MSLINGISNNIRVFEKLASKQDSDKANTPPLQATESSKVTLSEDAKALANFTNKGIAVSMKEFDTPLTKANAAGSSAQFSYSIVCIVIHATTIILASIANPIMTWNSTFFVLWRTNFIANKPPGQPQKNDARIKFFSLIRREPLVARDLSITNNIAVITLENR